MIRVEVWGSRALFTRPELKAERVSYDVMTPSAARGIIEAIYWHPRVRWIIDSIQVCNPVKFTNIRVNEVNSKVPGTDVEKMAKTGKGTLYLDTSKDRAQRNSMLLKDVRYIIEAHFEILESSDGDCPGNINHGKVQDIVTKRIKRGQCFHQPYLGCRDFTAYFKPAEDTVNINSALSGEKDLGLMLYDIDYSDRMNYKPMYFRAKMVDGYIKVPAPDSKEVFK